MRCLLIPACLICALAALGLSQDSKTACLQVEKTYDKFKDTTKVTLKPRRILQTASPREELDLSAEATLKGRPAVAPKEVEMIFASAGERWRYHDKADVTCLVDGKRLEAGTAYVLEGIPGPPLVRERLKLTLPLDTFLQIANAEDVELRLGPTRLRLAEKDLLALRAFASCMAD